MASNTPITSVSASRATIRRRRAAVRVASGLLLILGLLVVLGGAGGIESGGPVWRGVLIALAGLAMAAIGVALARIPGLWDRTTVSYDENERKAR